MSLDFLILYEHTVREYESDLLLKLELEKRGGLLRDTDYGAEIAMTVLLPEPEEAAFAAALRELSAGSLCTERTGTELHGVKIR